MLTCIISAKLDVLVLARVILFIVVHMGLCWICAGNCIDNPQMFQLLPSSTYTEARPFLPLTPCHQQAGSAQEVARGHNHNRLSPTDHRDIQDHMASCLAYKLGGKLARGHCSGTGWA